MEEYIDKNKLIRDLIDNRSFYPAIVKNAIKNAPIEDVVPRSEVEKAKQDVAREIFEEIKKKVKGNIKIYLEELNKEHIQDTPLYDRCSGIIFILQNIEDFLDNIEKKYIGE